MLQLKNISKQYKTGDLIQNALQGITVNFRDSEFVSILGPSGSGKTTLLNIIGGLDRYDNGELIINGKSTGEYKDRDWDSYRNHAIGFVFQSYNLIPHQSVLTNVELALTIAGVSRKERRRRAKEALNKVGLSDQMRKRPNQLSGGQMQRVAIARALINDPDILLADEPNGALDSETSIQVMELLKEVAKDRLVIMVTHNAELAETYSTRIIKLKDGMITADSDPFVPQEAPAEAQENKKRKARMTFATSLSLSFQNLRTKKGRTILTSFAGSIGIIGIALILALSSGVNTYIDNIQKDTMSSYPITISAETIDLTSVMGTRGTIMGTNESSETENTKMDAVYSDNSSLESSEAVLTSVTENDLTSFKKYLDDPDSEIQRYLGENGVVYTYDINFEVYTYDIEGSFLNTDSDTEAITNTSSKNESSIGSGMMGGMGGMSSMSTLMTGSTGSSSAENFSELASGSDGNTVSQVITDSYNVVYGSWPETYDEIVLVLDENNSIDTEVLYQLGFITADEYKATADAIAEGEDPDELTFDYSEICEHSFYLVAASDHYTENEDGTFSYISSDTDLEAEQLMENSLEIKISGILRPKEDAANATIETAAAYTYMLTDYVIDRCNSSDIVTAQEENLDINVLTGMEFEAEDDDEKADNAVSYLSSLGVSDKAVFYQLLMYYISENTENEGTSETDADSQSVIQSSSAETETQNRQLSGTGTVTMDENTMAQALDQYLASTPDEDFLISVYDEYISGSTYEENMSAFGKVSYDAPSSISIYTDSFEDKEAVETCIENYNKTVDGDTQITYTDYVAVLTSSITSIVDAISYVLIAFVAVSLIVSCIMIGIITHISVLERTKEIGILRALGASKKNISQVFNAETFIIGLCSGLLGVCISALLTIPINAIIQNVLGADGIQASLPILYAVILVVISMLITMLGGLLPARRASKKDPVVSLRTE